MDNNRSADRATAASSPPADFNPSLDLHIDRDHFGLPVRPFLAELDRRPDLSEKDKAAYLAEHAQVCHQAVLIAQEQRAGHQATITRERRSIGELDPDIMLQRVHHAASLERIEREGLHHKEGFATAEKYMEQKLQRLWPGETRPGELCDKMKGYYRQSSRAVPDEVVLSGKAGIKLLAEVAQAGNLVCGRLCRMILNGVERSAIRRGALAAKHAMWRDESERSALLRAVKAMSKPARGRAQGTGQLADPNVARLVSTVRVQARAMQAQSRTMERALALLPGGAAVQPAAPERDPGAHRTQGAQGEAKEEQRKVRRGGRRPAQGAARGTGTEPGEGSGAEPVTEPVPGPVPQSGPEPVRATAGPPAPPVSQTAQAPQDTAATGYRDTADTQDHDTTEDPIDSTDPIDEESIPQKPAPRPLPVHPDQHFIAVPYPHHRSVLSPAEIAACAVITVLHKFVQIAHEVAQLPLADHVYRIFDPRIQLYLRRALIAFKQQLARLLPDTKDLGEQGLALLQANFAESGDDPAAAHKPRWDTYVPYHLLSYLPQPLFLEDDLPLALTYLSFDIVQPYCDRQIPDPCEKRKQVFRLLGLLPCALEAVVRYRDTPGDPDHMDPMDPALAYQLRMAIEDAVGYATRLTLICAADADKAELMEHEWLEEEQRDRKACEQAQAGLVVVGNDAPSTQHTVAGTTPDGRIIAVTQDIASFVIASGNPGFGKTQFAQIVREGCHLGLPGLTTVTEPVRTIELITDWTKGDARICSFAGLSPSPYPDHAESLARSFKFRCQRDLCRFPHMTALCFPDELPDLYEEFAEERERGLILKPLGFHPDEQGSLFWRQMLSVGTSSNQQVRTQDRVLVDSIIGHMGIGCGVDKMEAECKRAKVRSYRSGALKMQMQMVRSLTGEEYLIDNLKQPWPLVFLLRSKRFGPDVLVPTEVCILAALSAALRDGSDPLRWFIMHEFAKHGLCEIIAPYFLESSARIRHGVCSYFLETQQIGFLPHKLVALATAILQYRCTNQKDYQLLQELFYAFSKVAFRHVAELPAGKAFAAFVRASDPLFRNEPFLLNLRPTATWAGGETMAVI